MNKKLLISLFYIFSFNLLHSQTNLKKNDAIGFANIIVENSTGKQIRKRFGKKYELINNNNFSYEIKYTQKGYSFYYLVEDNSQTIFSVKFYEPFVGTTQKGIKIGSTLQEVINYYGNPEYIGCDNCNYWTAGYPELGISFKFKRDLNLPHFPLQEKKHLGKEIFEIVVSKAKERARYAPPPPPSK